MVGNLKICLQKYYKIKKKQKESAKKALSRTKNRFFTKKGSFVKACTYAFS